MAGREAAPRAILRADEAAGRILIDSQTTLSEIPASVWDYRLGNRSALEWVIDQYRVERSKENPDDISSDPNRADDEEYIVRLVGQVVTVSAETVKLVKTLPALE